MNSLTITIGILAPLITFLIGRYYIKHKLQPLRDIEAARDYWKRESDRYYEWLITARVKHKDELKIISNLLSDSESVAINCQMKIEWLELTTPKFQLVANKDKHPAANDNYLYIKGEVNGNREAGLFTLNDWSKAKERLLKNPEDKPL